MFKLSFRKQGIFRASVPVNTDVRLLQGCHGIRSKCPLSVFQVPCLFPLDFSEARAIFLVGQNHVKKVNYHLFIYLFIYLFK